MAIRYEDVVDVVGVTVLVISAVIIYFTTSKQLVSESVGGKKGWRLIMVASLLFAIRALGHFIDAEWFQIIRRSFGIIGAVIYPLALYYMNQALSGAPASRSRKVA